MIYVNRGDTDKAKAAVQALQSAKAADRGYNLPEVNAALREMFHGKCYICENKEVSSYQIEHLKSHRGDLELKYDWNNLFLACAHCNNIKGAGYEPILDCTKQDVDLMIAFRKAGYFGTEETFSFDALEEGAEVENTVKLLQDVFYGTTPQKKLEARNLRNKLRRDLSAFKEYIREYQDAEDDEKEDLLCKIKQELKAGAGFVAFKRWLLRDHPEAFQDLMEKCGIAV